MRRLSFIFLVLSLALPVWGEERCSFKVENITRKTYMYSDADPVAHPQSIIYPYYRFDGYTTAGVPMEWTRVTLENDYISVSIYPQIGGKIWGAVDKTTGLEFIYDNGVVKFRDIALRGAWTSGGVEFNFGIIGHAPTTATPVDWTIRRNRDGSVSCFVGSYEHLTSTRWQVEIRLESDKAYFTTNTLWHNGSGLDQPYYQWMNAAYKASQDLEFWFPGDRAVHHDGKPEPYPQDGSRETWKYSENAYGGNKSYHVLGHQADFRAGYWRDDKLGSVHYAPADDMLGMKIFLWSMARSGAIWEDLLTDDDGQYVEMQSGRLYTQPRVKGDSPLMSKSFAAGSTDLYAEYWFPTKDTEGIRAASSYGAMNLFRSPDGSVQLRISPNVALDDTVRLFQGGKAVWEKRVLLTPLQTWKESVALTSPEPVKAVLGDGLLAYAEDETERKVSRPFLIPEDYDYDTPYAHLRKGTNLLNEKKWTEGEAELLKALEGDRYFAPALVRLASLYCRLGRHEAAIGLCRRALSLDACDAEAGYIYGMSNLALGNRTDARDGFSSAAHSYQFHSASCTALAAMYLEESNLLKAREYIQKSLLYNTLNQDAWCMEALLLRKGGSQDKELAERVKEHEYAAPLNQILRFERHLRMGTFHSLEEFISGVKCENPDETFIEMALWYEKCGCIDEALQLYDMAVGSPIARIHAAFLLHRRGDDGRAASMLEDAVAMSPLGIFPFRPATLPALEWASQNCGSWKIEYYTSLVKAHLLDEDAALEHLANCDSADFWPLFVTRASLQKSDNAKMDDLLKAESFADADWRVGNEIITLYGQMQLWEEARAAGEKYYRKWKGNSAIGINYAQALLKTGRYTSCIEILSGLNVLPCEWTTEGHAIYRAACLHRSIELMGRKSYKSARQMIEKAMLWPENLGVGKPYDSEIDLTVEKMLLEQIELRRQGLQCGLIPAEELHGMI